MSESSWYLRLRALDNAIIDGTTEEQDLEALAEWVEKNGNFEDSKGLLHATNSNLEEVLKRLLDRPGVRKDMATHYVIRVLKKGTLRSIPGSTHFRVLRVHKDTKPTARLLSDTPSSTVQLSSNSIIEFRGRVEISPAVDAVVILKNELNRYQGAEADKDGKKG